MRVVLAVGNSRIEEKILSKDEIVVVDKGNNLYELKDLIPYLEKTDFLIVNKSLDKDNDVLMDIVVQAQKKSIKVIILTNDFNSSKAKKEINCLVAEEVYSFMDIDKFNEDELLQVLKDYPKEFDFRLIATPDIQIVEMEKVIEKEKIVRSQIITCFSNDDSFASATMTVELAYMFTKVTDLKILVMDLNTFSPVLDHFLGVEPYLNVNTKYELDKQTSLGAVINAIERGNLTNEIFEQLVINLKQFDFISGLYDPIKDEKIKLETYDKLIEKASKIYDVIIINTNPYLKSEATYSALLKATRIIGITNSNFTAIRNILSTFKIIAGVVSKDDIGIVVNNDGEFSLTNDLLDKAISKDNGYKILGIIPHDEKIEKALNSGSPYYKVISKEIQENYNEIMINLGYKLQEKKKMSFFRRR